MKRSVVKVVAVLLSLVSPALVAADGAELDGELLRQERLGYYYYGRGDMFGALKHLVPVAEAGHGLSQYRVGQMEEASTNFEAAEAWYLMAIKAGVLEANYALANMYSNALLRDADHVKAYRLQLAAAERGFVPAMFSVANAQERGLGADPDPESALAWYRKAADAGYIAAIRRLRKAYQLGELGLAKDQAEFDAQGQRAVQAEDDLRASSDKARREAFEEFRAIEKRYLNGVR